MKVNLLKVLKKIKIMCKCIDNTIGLLFDINIGRTNTQQTKISDLISQTTDFCFIIVVIIKQNTCHIKQK